MVRLLELYEKAPSGTQYLLIPTTPEYIEALKNIGYYSVYFNKPFVCPVSQGRFVDKCTSDNHTYDSLVLGQWVPSEEQLDEALNVPSAHIANLLRNLK